MYKTFCLLICACCCLHPLLGQVFTEKKYPSLLWEITGNGLQKPSYLFGTMHVSSKMAFHLSDSFYLAIKNVDAVALELNPDVWQEQMVKIEAIKNAYQQYSTRMQGDYLGSRSFRLNDYTSQLKTALSTAPVLVNSLLYRSFKAREDFEEDTFLDLYIFQTGRKLGKRGTGVEDYYETEKIVMEAYGDMAAEKKKKRIDTDAESLKDISEKIQDAYKRGDLDLLDSLDRKIDRSDAFREKFLYYRNEIQANSMDSIMKKSSLFVGVGSAHLPGPRGVIELLRKKGYHLRPIAMADRNANHKEEIDRLTVPVQFRSYTAKDGSFTVSVPGALYTTSEDYSKIDRLQYADMSNGSYYQVARVKTHAALLHQDSSMVRQKIDSLLYENIPGKILEKKWIQRNGFNGYDITNKTRRGDLQRYNIFITPAEILIFKMSGKENYVGGAEAVAFFNSISLRQPAAGPVTYTPAQGGFSVRLPQEPVALLNEKTSDQVNQWEYDAVNETTGDAYLLVKKSVNNFGFLDEDSFNLRLMETSFSSSDYFQRQIGQYNGLQEGYPFLQVQEKMKDSSLLTARFLIKGPHYYVMAVRANDTTVANAYFNSFRFVPYQYGDARFFSDSFLHFSVSSPVTPLLDSAYRAIEEKAGEEATQSFRNPDAVMPTYRNALFVSDSTGEVISVNVQKLHPYYHVRKPEKFWEEEIKNFDRQHPMLLFEKKEVQRAGNSSGYTLTYRDTGSSATIYQLLLLKNNYIFRVTAMGDTAGSPGKFITGFMNSFTPADSLPGNNIFDDQLDRFFTDLFSTDSTTQAKARQSISYLYYGEKGVPKIMQALKKLSPASKDYFEVKTRLIAELGYIKDSTSPVVVNNLKKIYNETADTAMFQNEVIQALARNGSKAAATAFKELVLQDPPVFDNQYLYTHLFSNFEDSLPLAATLYPDILQLTTLEDYKEPLLKLMVRLVDSGYLGAARYSQWFNKIFFDAKIALKKQKIADEKKMEEERKSKDDEQPYAYAPGAYNNNVDDQEDLAILLAPFYNQRPAVQKYFSQLLQSRDQMIQLNTALVLLKNRQQVADSLTRELAANDQLRAKLYAALEKMKRPNLFPAIFKKQEAMARSVLAGIKGYDKIDSISLVGKETVTANGKKGIVYFFKYRVKPEDDWKIGISGMQPENIHEVSSDDSLASRTGKKLNMQEDEMAQFREQLKRILFDLHPAAKKFFDENLYDYLH